MRKTSIYIMACLFMFSCNNPSQEATENTSKTISGSTPEENRPPLFNGEDKSGWIPKIRGYELGENHGNTFRMEGDGKLLREGYISLQSESHPVDFRRVEILRLD